MQVVARIVRLALQNSEIGVFSPIGVLRTYPWGKTQGSGRPNQCVGRRTISARRDMRPTPHPRTRYAESSCPVDRARLRTSIVESPRLVNFLRGEMSLSATPTAASHGRRRVVRRCDHAPPCRQARDDRDLAGSGRSDLDWEQAVRLDR